MSNISVTGADGQETVLYAPYPRTNAGHKGLKYKTRVDAGKTRKRSCACGADRHRSPSGKLYAACLACKNTTSREWIKNNKERWYTSQKNYRLRKEFGIDLKQYREMLAQQDYKCGICRCKLKDSRIGDFFEKPHVDHDHRTGKVRELLCGKCNWLLGSANDDSEILFSAIDYLRKHASE